MDDSPRLSVFGGGEGTRQYRINGRVDHRKSTEQACYNMTSEEQVEQFRSRSVGRITRSEVEVCIGVVFCRRGACNR